MTPGPNGPTFVGWHFRDFDDATDEWDTRTVGTYVRLLNRQARVGDLPNDVPQLAKLAGEDPTAFEQMWRNCIRAKFEPLPDNPSRLVNLRMAREREKALVKAEASRSNGRAHRQTEPTGLPSGLATGCPSSTSPSISPSSSSSRKRKVDGELELRVALETIEAEAAAPVRSDLIAAAEAYRARRVKRRGSVWDRDQWLELLRPWASDPLPLIEGLRQATQAGWLSVHPRGQGQAQARPTAAQERDRRSKAAIASFLSRCGSGASQEAPSES